jgi:hypothetical protein
LLPLTKLSFLPKQKGIKEMILHHLFKGPGLYGDWFFPLMMILDDDTGPCPWCHFPVQLVWILEEVHCAFAAFIWLEFLDKVELHPSGMCVWHAFWWSQQFHWRGIAVIRLSRVWGKGQATHPQYMYWVTF